MPDAHLPRRPLHDGRALGRLQPDEQRARAVRARRGELLRPRRQPPRRRARYAGPGRRLLRAAGDDLRLPRAAARQRSRCRPTTPRSREAEAGGARADAPAAVGQRARARSTTSTASSARSCGTTAAWPAASESLEKALAEIPALREEFYADVHVLGERRRRSTSRSRRPAASPTSSSSASCSAATRCTARSRCGGHFRVEHQTEDGEALRDDEQLLVRRGVGVHRRRHATPTLHKEPLEFEYVHLAQRSYK